MPSSAKVDQAFHERMSSLDSLQIARHIVQLIVLVGCNAKLLGFPVIPSMLVPYLWPAQSPYGSVHGVYDALEYTLAQATFPILALGVIWLTAILVGRVFCGWACPLGTLQDFLVYLPIKKRRLSRETSSTWKDVKWGAVAFSVGLSILVGYRRYFMGINQPANVISDGPFNFFSPHTTIFSYLPYMVAWNSSALSSAGMWGWSKMAAMFALLVPAVFVPRFFCRFVCPLGAMLEPFSRFKFLRIERNPRVTTEQFNKVLDTSCPMGVTIPNTTDYTSSFIAHGGCIHCGKCLVASPDGARQRIF